MAMLVKASAALAPLSASSEASRPPSPALRPSLSSSFAPFRSPRRMNRRVSTAVVAGSSHAVTGVLFQPFEEIQSDAFLVPVTCPSLVRSTPMSARLPLTYRSSRFSFLARTDPNSSYRGFNPFLLPSVCVFSSSVEYTNSYIYHALFAYFDRDNVALKGFARFFKDSSQEERDHAEKLMEYQNKRGGRVKLQSIATPLSEFNHAEKGDALYAMELALCLEKLTNEKLLGLHDVAEKCNDAQMADFIESEFLEEQVEAIKKISEYVAQLRRVGKGHGEGFGTLIGCCSTKESCTRHRNPGSLCM
ncbi:hypothetical protein MUK42_02362 [Musa troglodytarum]|uniref:Ferritin n=1 Tax=Musa troglodytarum TaxID=320322 RepID=A0A9E7JK78_9LILI|nr:hypothetical protein MUK42_02362 [Musa troglodytarum]